MSYREISGTMLRKCFGAVHKDVTPAKVLKEVLEQIAFVQRDLDITGDMDSHYYYEGMIDAFEAVAFMLAPLKHGKEKDYYDLVGKVFNAAKIVKEAAA